MPTRNCFSLEHEIENGGAPSYYNFSWDDSTSSLVLRIRVELMPEFYEFFTLDNPIIKNFSNNKVAAADNFVSPKNRKFWGFG